ncbi:hypothetical protein ACWD0A_27980 [Streptomyces sp. NPDC002867]
MPPAAAASRRRALHVTRAAPPGRCGTKATEKAALAQVAAAGIVGAEHCVDVTAHLDRGAASLAAHETYLRNLAGGLDPERFLRRQAADAGRRAGVPPAVAFEVPL